MMEAQHFVQDETGLYTLAEWTAKQRNEKTFALLEEIRDLLKIIVASSAKPL